MRSFDYTNNNLLFYLPERLKRLFSKALSEKDIEEIRIRTNKPIQLIAGSGEFFLRESESGVPVCLDAAECAALFDAFCRFSVYAYENELRQGYLTLPGGYRVGIAGKTVTDSNSQGGRISVVTSFNIRIARQHIGCAAGVIKDICADNRPLSSLLISPPGAGKTTMLRDLARLISDGFGCLPLKVCIVDERSEIAGCADGVPQNDVGRRTDVLDACLKSYGMRMAVRSLSPDVIITDELGTEADADAVLDAANCGITVITSAHGNGLESIRARPPLRRLLDNSVFARLIILKNVSGKRAAVCLPLEAGGVA